MFILGANSAGLFNKKESFLRNISLFKPGVFFIQESKARIKNKLTINDYIIFEQIRKNLGGGGLLTAVHKSLKPITISTDEEVELLVVEATLLETKVRFINGYGPQEKAPEDMRKSFFMQLDLEIKKSKLAGAFICIEMDSNAKLGSRMIPGDPKEQSENGKLLEKVVFENSLIVVNGTDLCKGVITRFRKTINNTEQSVIDHFIVCKNFFELVINMTIDKAGKYSLTKYTNKIGSSKCTKESDHRTLILEIDYGWVSNNNKESERIEIFNYRNNEDFSKFQILTNENEELEHCFDDTNEDLEVSSLRWLKIVKKIIRRSFRKIRLKKNNLPPKLEKLFLEKEKIKTKIAENENLNYFNNDLIEELEHVNDSIAQLCADKNKNLVDEYLGRKNDVIEGYGQAKTWALKKKLCPKNVIEAPAAKKNEHGELITDKKDLENLYHETYKKRLKPNPNVEGFEELYETKEYLYKLQLKLARAEVSDSWSMEDLEKALKKCKNGKARDEYGFVYEIFKYGGSALKVSLLQMFNLSKKTQTYPLIFSPANISSFWKKKGDRSDLENDRGVFNVSKIRSIMDKMIYNDIYDTVDANMSSSNIGARKHRSINDHLFVINGIVNDVLNNGHNSSVDVQIYDVTKCFDKLEYVNTSTDLYNAGVTDDKFVTIVNSNKNCHVAVKTPWGSKTQRTNIENLEMQGTVLSGLKCSVTIDTIGKECLQDTQQSLYKYKKTTSIPPLSLIDDIITVSNCSSESILMNATIQSKLQGKRLELGHRKCFKMHIGKDCTGCPSLNVNKKEMLTATNEKYLGQIISSNGRLDNNITDRFNKGLGIVNEIIGILKEVSFGYHYFPTAILFRNSKLVSSMLCSIETLYGLTNAHIEKLEQCDRLLLRKVFSCISSTAIEAFYLEANILPFRHIIIARRLMYYWNVLQKSESELVRQVLITQQLSPVKNDWCVQVWADLELCGITLSESDISKLSKYQFKNLVRTKVTALAKNYLIDLKNKHSKSSGLSTSFEKMQDYLYTDNLSLEEKQLLFQFRTRTYPCKTNFKNQYGPDLSCHACLKEDSPDHLLQCNIHDIDTSDIEYQHIFGNIEQQTRIIKILKKIDVIRNNLLNKSPSSGSQVHPL